MYGYTELFMHMFLELLFNLPMNWFEEFIVHFTHDTLRIIMVGDDEYFVTFL